ncbi:DedA family protein [Xinfangfangia sp. D13-10-4-6]|uniref:YqaA family protein n=1 Tax=Pseudogemmobacter hezensis TaxID=2737662 RepID=UPI001555A6D2|nr:YqaA family protein [Pseudogemmobacter hezensis]NPD15137.1 DedA family protein [Pseudogemmobacter hezensis]
MFELLGLFAAALIAATLLPAQSEAVLVALIIADIHPLWVLLVVATAGNVLGSMINWSLGRFLIRFSDRRWFPVSQRQLDRAGNWYGRWGHWSLLASWVPVIGDPLTLAAGVLREPFWRFALIVTLAKGGRYLVLSWITIGLI